MKTTGKRYLAIYEQVKQDIIDGRYKTGTKLPSKRVMAESMDVSVITIQHAYELLDEEGYILSKEKSGYFVVFNDADMFTGQRSKKERAFLSRVEAATDNSNVTTDLFSFSPSIYAKTTRKVLTDLGEEVMQKCPMKGVPRLREAIAEYLSRSRHIDVIPEQIVIGAGAEYLYRLLVQFFGRDIMYGLESPSYQKIAKVYEAAGAPVEMLKLGKDGIESEALWNSKANILHITPYRSFPSGVTASAYKKREYLKWSMERDAFVIEDDFESEFTPSRKPEETLFSLDENGRVVYVNTFSRTISSSLRVAYMLLPIDLLEEFENKVGFYECPVPTLEQHIIAQLIEGGDFERHINRVRRHNRM